MVLDSAGRPVILPKTDQKNRPGGGALPGGGASAGKYDPKAAGRQAAALLAGCGLARIFVSITVPQVYLPVL